MSTKKRVFILPSIFLTVIILLTLSCTKESPVSAGDSRDAWTFKGQIENGLTGDWLVGAVVTYNQSDSTPISDTTDTNGTFSIKGIPAGEAHFQVSYTKDTTTAFTKAIISDASSAQGANSNEDILMDQSQIVSLYPLNGAIAGNLKAQNTNSAAGSFIMPNAHLTLTYNTAGMHPSLFTTTSDSTGSYSFNSIPVTGTSPVLSVAPISLNGEVYTFTPVNVENITEGYTVPLIDQIMSAASNTELEILASNVLSNDGQGLNNVPIDISPYYVLSEALDSSTIEISEDGADFDALITISGDTIIIDPVNNFNSGDIINFVIYGQTLSGKYVTLDLTSPNRNFKTEKSIFVVGSNIINADGDPVSNFPLYSEIWIKYSEALDTNVSEILWTAAPDADHNIYASGTAQPNATARVSGDTLFITPDNRIALNYGSMLGFSINVSTPNGKTSGYIPFYANLEESNFFIQWTNALDSLGNIKDQFGLRDTVIIVASQAIAKITKISGNGNTTPTDISLDNLTISVTGDTIRYIPAVKLAGGTTYGIDFDVILPNGAKLTDQLSTTWKTEDNIQIVSTNNRDVSTGLFRAFKVLGDSLVVKFSKAIDTSSSAPTIFRLNDWYGIIDYTVTWSADLKIATIKNTSPLQAGGFSEDAYKTGAATAVYPDIDFAVTASNGEEIKSLKPDNTDLELHTEQEIWLAGCNALTKVSPLRPIDIGSVGPYFNGQPDTVSPSSNITLTFNRAVDTSAIKANPSNLYSDFFKLSKVGSSIDLEFALTFSADAKTITLNPVSDLETGAKYDLVVTDIPAIGINETFSGNGESNTLIENTESAEDWDFEVTPVIIDISALTVDIAVDTAYGFSPGSANYSGTMAPNGHLFLAITESAWNANHADSVDGYQARVRKAGGNWFTCSSILGTNAYNSLDPLNGAYNTAVDIDLTGEEFYTTDYLLSNDLDGGGINYTNGPNLFNSASAIEVQVRPMLTDNGSGDPAYGVWSSIVTFTDNTAPCDVNHTTNYSSSSNGGVSISESGLNFDNSAGTGTDSSGYISITFPEDMKITGAIPTVAFYYGSFTDSTDPVGDPSVAPTANTTLSKWVNARTYHLYVNIPVFDYTDDNSGDGAYYNISVAGCMDASSLTIAAHGMAGADAKTTFDTDNTNLSMALVNAGGNQTPGSISVIDGFTLCD